MFVFERDSFKTEAVDVYSAFHAEDPVKSQPVIARPGCQINWPDIPAAANHVIYNSCSFQRD